MKKESSSPSTQSQSFKAQEKSKRRKEKFVIWGLVLLFLALIWFEFRLFKMSETLPFQHSIFFFGLINFNIILFLFLMFLIFRNVVKNFSEREGGPIGSSLKNKLIAAFVGFSFVPTALMFVVSVVYINNSFDRWFNEKMSSVLRSSIEVTNSYYLEAKNKNYHFASKVTEAIKQTRTLAGIEAQLEGLRRQYSLDAVEFYPSLLDDRLLSYAKEEGVPLVPSASLEFLERGVRDGLDASFIHQFAEGDLVRVIVPANWAGGQGAVVVSSFVPMSLIHQMEEIAAAYENFRDTDPLAYPVKSIYLIILVLMTMVILLCATWFGFYLARQLSIPLEKLALATQRVVKGDYQSLSVDTGSPEIKRLITNFNKMTEFLGKSETEVMEANQSLRKTLTQLNEHSRYIEVVLAHVTTGVISINEKNIVTMINRHAAKLLDIEPSKHIGKGIQEVLNNEYYNIFEGLLTSMKAHSAENLSKEIQITVKGRPLLLQMTISLLHDDQGRELGKVLVFDDMSLMLSAQRAAAWTEVARKIAHEIKNPLTPISLAAQRLQRKFGEEINDPAFSDCTNMIVNQVDGLKHLVNEFSQFARMPKTKLAMGSLNTTIEQALELFRQGELGYKLSFLPDTRLPDCLFDSDQIKRVVTNLVDNAVESVKGKKHAEIEVETVYDSILKIVKIVVSDNGSGISSGLRHRIFEPYVTTKNHGTGLGLAIVKRAVEDHNGYVRALENKPRGSRFVVELPVLKAGASATIVVSNKDKDL